MSDYGPLLDEVRRLRWRATRPVRGALPGAHPSARRGTSAEFAEYRPYRQGDPLARLDWKLFARTDRPYLRLSTDRTVLPTMLVVDASESMNFPAGRESKAARSRQLAVGLAAVAHHEGDPVGVAIATTKPALSLPRTRSGIVGEIAALLDRHTAGSSGSLVETLRSAARVAQRLVLIGDVLAEEEALLATLRSHLARGGESHLVHVVAKEELDPAEGPVHDPERRRDVRLLDAAGLTEYGRRFAQWREALAAGCRAAGISYTLSQTGSPVAADIRRIVAGVAPEPPR